MFQYQNTNRYFAKVSRGLEPLAEEELTDLGADDIVHEGGGISFVADREALYRINYLSRLVIRLLAPILSFRCRDRKDLYDAGKSIEWTKFFQLTDTFAVHADVSANDQLRHSKFAALCFKDAVVDQFREITNRRPDVNDTDPDVWLNLHIAGENAVISVDTSGGSLHKRGYRKEGVDAPIQETIAAALLRLSGWNGDRPLYDPMCGSGTLLCEALMSYCRIPSGFFRKRFGFFFLPDFDRHLWDDIRKNLDSRIGSLSDGLIGGSDIDSRAVSICRKNLNTLPGSMKVSVAKKDFRDIAAIEGSVIVCNPPYGIRMKTRENLGEFYRQLGDFLKNRCKGSDAYIYFGNREMVKHMGLRTSFKKAVKNAGIDGRVVKYELY